MSETVSIDQKEQIKLFEKVSDEHKPITAFLILHGCRPREARALKCKDVDLEHGSITISATFSGRKYCTRRKGRGARVAVIPLHLEMKEFFGGVNPYYHRTTWPSLSHLTVRRGLSDLPLREK